MQQIEIILKNEKEKLYRNIAWIFLVLNFVIFIFLLFFDAYRAIALVSITAFVFYILLRWYVLKKQKPDHFFDEFVFFIPAMCWFGMHSYILMIALISMGILYRFSLQKLKFVFTPQKVLKANFPKKEFDWNSISNVILKDNVLTLDFKNNKLIQAEIEKSQNVNETEFNSFVQTQLSNGGSSKNNNL